MRLKRIVHRVQIDNVHRTSENALKMDVASFPADEEALKVQLAASKALGEALTGKGALHVTIKGDTNPAA
jgi:hypothetical protein